MRCTFADGLRITLTACEACAQVALQARHVAENSRRITAEHWNLQRPPQQAIAAALGGAAQAAEQAQRARRRAVALACALDVAIHKHLGGADWPEPTMAK